MHRIHPLFADRFDLTLECIRRRLHGEANLLAEALQKYADFFLLDDLLNSATSQIRFIHRFHSLSSQAVPKIPSDLIDYLQADNEFVEACNRRAARRLD